MDMDLSPKFSKPMFEGEGGSYYTWSSKEFPVLGEAKVGAGLLILKPGGFALPHYADSSKVGYVLQGENGVAGLVTSNAKTNSKEETVVGLETGDIIGVPLGLVSWWYNHGNSDLVIAFLGETSKAYIPGEFTYFLLTGAQGILGGFSTEFTSRALHINQKEANLLAKGQTGVLIVKLDPEERNNIPKPSQNIVNKWVKNIVQFSPEIHVEKAGEATSFTGKNFPILEEIGLQCSLVKLEADAMLSPLYSSTDASVQVTYVVKGSGKVQIVGTNGKLVLNNKIMAGQVFVVPRFFVFGVIAESEGMECFSIKITSQHADFVDYASKQSVLNAFAPSVLQSALNVSQEFVKFIKGKLEKTDILVPPMN